jgi:hypothetical protein
MKNKTKKYKKKNQSNIRHLHIPHYTKSLKSLKNISLNQKAKINKRYKKTGIKNQTKPPIKNSKDIELIL